MLNHSPFDWPWCLLKMPECEEINWQTAVTITFKWRISFSSQTAQMLFIGLCCSFVCSFDVFQWYNTLNKMMSMNKNRLKLNSNNFKIYRFRLSLIAWFWSCQWENTMNQRITRQNEKEEKKITSTSNISAWLIVAMW